MKKTIKLLIVLFIMTVTFIYNNNVYAAEDCNKYACATCVYKNENGKFVYDIKSDGSENLIVNFTHEGFPASFRIQNEIDNQIFVGPDNKISCVNIYSDTLYPDSDRVKLTAKHPISQMWVSELTPDLVSSTNNNKNIIVVDDTTNSMTCAYSSLLSECTIIINDDAMLPSCTNGYILNNKINISDFHNNKDCVKATLACAPDLKSCTLTKNTYNVSTSSTYTCTYTGQTSGKTLTITKTSNKGKWTIVHPDGKKKTLEPDEVGSNILPSSNCEDIFYISDASDKIRMVDFNSNYYKNYIASYCNKYKNVEQFCSGDCDIVNPLCGSDDSDIDSGNCPRELKPIIIFIKKVAFNSLQFIIPILLILMGTIDMTKAVVSNDDKGIKDATSKLIKRVLAAILFFFATTIVNIVIGRIAEAGIDGTDNWQSCWYDIE